MYSVVHASQYCQGCSLAKCMEAQACQCVSCQRSLRASAMSDLDPQLKELPADTSATVPRLESDSAVKRERKFENLLKQIISVTPNKDTFGKLKPLHDHTFHAEGLPEAITDDSALPAVQNEKGYRSVTSTNKRRMEEKAGIVLINLIADDPAIVEVAKHSTDILYLSSTAVAKLDNDLEDQNQQQDMKYMVKLVLDLRKDIWIFIREVPLKDPEILKIFNMLTEIRREAMKHSNLSLSSFPIQVFLKTYKTNHCILPRESESIRYTTFPSHEPQKVASFLVMNYENRKVKVTNMLRRLSDPYFECSIKLVLSDDAFVTAGELPYIEESYDALKEHLDDPNSSLRQQLHHWHKIPNVRVVELEDGTMEAGLIFNRNMIVEFRPLQLQGFQLFYDQVGNGGLASIIRQNLLVKRQEYRGMVLVEMSDIYKTRMEEILGEATKTETSVDGMSCQEFLSLCSLVVTEVYKRHLEDHTKLPVDFLRLLNQQGCIGAIDKMMSVDGRNAMHMAVLAGREDFLKMLFFLNKWGDLRGEAIKPSPTQKHVGFTPRRLAETLAYTTKGQDVLRQYDHLESLSRNLSTLAKAALGGHLELVKILVSADPRMLKEDTENGLSALSCAAGAGHIDVVKFLLEKGVKVENHAEMSCTMLAIMFDHMDVLKELADHMVDVAGRRHGDGLNAVDYSIMTGQLGALRIFKSSKFQIPGKALSLAVKHGRIETLTFLLEECKLDVNTVDARDKRTALHHAVLAGNAPEIIAPILTQLLKHGAKLNSTDRFGRTVLHAAAEFNQLAPLGLLLRSTKKSGELPALINKQDIYTGKDIYYLIRGRDRGQRAWHWLELRRMNLHLFKKALSQGQLDVADHGKVLFSGFGASPDKTTNDKMQATQEAALKPENQKVDMTPLHYGANKEHLEIVRLLLEYGADPNVTDSLGATPAHHAAMRGNLPILIALVEHGAKLDARTSDGQSVSDIAEKNEHEDIINYLGANPYLTITQKFLVEAILRVKSDLNDDVLMQKRSQGVDVRRHLINSLRELSIDVNSMLVAIGSGPVLEASSGD